MLYLWAGAQRKPDSDDASPEGHYIQFGKHGEVIAITIVNARRILEREGKIVVTAAAWRRHVARSRGNVFAELMETVKVASLGDTTEALYAVGGEYRRNM